MASVALGAVSDLTDSAALMNEATANESTDRAPASRDAEWIAAVARGDRRALDHLYREYAPRIFRFALRLTHNATSAEEVANDVMLEVWKSARHYERRSLPSTWILGIARHRALNAIRGRHLSLAPLDGAAEVADSAPDAATELDQAALRVQLTAAMNRLPAEQREVLELTFMEGLSCAEAAKVVHCPENTVKTRVYYAKKKLEPLLTRLRLREAL
jgi:RNA polymerase sigma-70 factor (ECF subfamily)